MNTRKSFEGEFGLYIITSGRVDVTKETFTRLLQRFIRIRAGGASAVDEVHHLDCPGNTRGPTRHFLRLVFPVALTTLAVRLVRSLAMKGENEWFV